MSKVFVLSEVYFPETASTSYLLTQTAEGLSKDFAVEVITGPASKFLDTIDYGKSFEIVNGVPVFRCAGTRFDKDSLAGRVVNMLTRSLAILICLLRRCKAGDVVLVVTSPPALPFVAYLVSKLKRIQYVVLLHDVYPEVMQAVGVLDKGSIVTRALQNANARLYDNATRIIAIGRDMARLAGQKMKNAGRSIVVIPNWADTDLIAPRAKSESALAVELELVNRFVVLYAGNLSRANAIDTIAQAALLLAPNDNIRFVFIGYGARKTWLQEFAQKHNLGNVHILPPMPRNEQMNFLNCADIALATLLPNMTGVSVPSRTYSFMAAGKPIVALCEAGSELGRCVSEESIGWVLDPSDAAQLAQTILAASKSPECLVDMARRAVAAAGVKYSREVAMMRYRDLFHDLGIERARAT
jgi:colanic acid biosynthesis glycosyl transferase WcaI